MITIHLICKVLHLLAFVEEEREMQTETSLKLLVTFKMCVWLGEVGGTGDILYFSFSSVGSDLLERDKKTPFNHD